MPKEDAPKSIPILTDVVAREFAGVDEDSALYDVESLIAELQTQLAAEAFALTEQTLRSAFAEMEASLNEQISARLREELPELIDRILRTRLTGGPEEP